MLTDKQIFLCCGLLSLGFHLCTWGVWSDNWRLWEQRITPQLTTIQVSLISAEMVPKNVQKKSQPVVKKEIPSVVAFPTTKLKIVTRSKPVKNVPRLVTKTISPQQIISQKQPEKQLQQKMTTPAPSEKVVVTTAESLKFFEPYSVTEDNFDVQDSAIASYNGEEEAPVSGAEQVSAIAVAEKRIEEKSVKEPGQGIESSYLIHIREMIEKHLDYPTRARRLHITGEVNLSFNITTSGDIDEILILAESSYPILNKAAIRAVKQATPFPQPQRKIKVELPILFSLN